MIEITGNFWDYIKDYDALVCTTNCVISKSNKLVMGKSLALDFRNRFPGIDALFAKDILNHPNNFFCSIHWWFSRTDMKHLIAFPTKTHYKYNSNLGLIENSLQKLVEWTNVSKVEKVLMVRPGCSNGRLDWETQVKPLCLRYLDDRFTVINNE